MFNQNVFGLEPATVRVREVRIGRAERRARRRAAARETELLGGEGTGEGRDGMTLDNDARDTQVITTVMTVGNDADNQNVRSTMSPNPLANDSAPSVQRRGSGRSLAGSGTPSSAAEATVPATTTSGARVTPSAPAPSTQDTGSQGPESIKTPLFPYTTFQQLSFAPNFPLAVIADEYLIPPTYLDFVGYQKQHEAGIDITEIPTTLAGEPNEIEVTSNGVGDDQISVPKAPPGLPKPPARWVYRDPKGILRGQ